MKNIKKNLRIFSILILFFTVHCYAEEFLYNDKNDILDSDWQEITTTNSESLGSTNAILKFKGQLYFGTDKGLFRLVDDEQGKAMSIKEFEGKKVLHLVEHQEQLVVNTGHEVYFSNNGIEWIENTPGKKEDL